MPSRAGGRVTEVPAGWRRLAAVVHRHPRAIVVIATVLALAAVGVASQLRVDADLWRLLPPDYPSYQALDAVREAVGGENPAEVVIESPSFEANRRFAEAFLPAALALRGPEGRPYFARVEYRRDVDFLRRHALYFATDQELDSLVVVLDRVAARARRDANPLTRRVADPDPDASVDRLATALERLVGTEYPISPDSTVMVLRLHPTSSQGDLTFVRGAVSALRQLALELQPSSYHPAMTVDVGGRFVQEELEAASIVRHVRWGSAVALPLILLLVALYLGPHVPFGRPGWGRRLRVAVVIGLPLAMSVAWTYALARVAFGVLNVVTTTLALVLVGMGVDYGLHWLAAWTEERRRGTAPATVLALTYADTAKAITVGALTTAASLFALTVADFRAFREFGFLAGCGILLALAAALLVLPALVLLADEGVADPGRVPAPGPMPRPGRPWARLIVVLGLMVAAAWTARRVQFEYQSNALRPEFPAYHALRRKAELVPAAVRGSPAIILADAPGDVPILVQTLRARAAHFDIIGQVDALQDRVPLTPAAQASRLARLAEIRALLDGPVLGRSRAPELSSLRMAAGVTHPVPVEILPPSLVGAFTTRRGDLGRVVLVYPSRSLSDARNSLAFAEAVGSVHVGPRTEYHAASMAIVAADMLRLMQRDSRRVLVLLTLGLVAMMLVTFRHAGWAAVALVPTIVGGAWLAGTMGAFDLRLNLFNLAVLPVILGVGNDVGVHLVHGFRHGGWPGLAAARRRITVAILTTAMGYGALAATGHPGITSIGVLAVLGLLATLGAGLAAVPALIAIAPGRR